MYSSNSDKITRDYLDSLLIETRYLDSVIPDTTLNLFGHSFATPIMTAALSHLSNTAPDGMRIYAKGAALSNTVHWVGMGDDAELESIAATGAKTIKIIKPHADNREVFRKIGHAISCGCIAVGMDIDHSFQSNGQYDNVMGLPMKAKSTEELREFVQASSVPFIVKGVMSAKDAEKCLSVGAGGIVVSHHHGMVDYSCPPLMVLPDILKATGGSIPVFVDCGIESGMDAYKAMALGATAVSVGRHLMPMLKDGEHAVSDEINRMTATLAGVMARTGIADTTRFEPSVIHKRNF
ncbi:MAG: alpha-hydroxy-acid oxidizing protein [Bacteroidaceae bacterium]|nr:alpha-hydroxy-acid oxidizing protein [Bacteroidaceae bacterium]